MDKEPTIEPKEPDVKSDEFWFNELKLTNKQRRELKRSMKELQNQGWSVSEYEKADQAPPCQIERCGGMAKWFIEGNCYCAECALKKGEEFKKMAEERGKKINL